MISWNIHVDRDTFHVYDNDVIHAEHYKIAKSAIFRALHATEGNLSRYLFEDIRVEDAHFRLFDLTLDDNKWHDPALGWGSLDTLIFRDIRADGPFDNASLIHGADGDHLVSNVALQNVSIGSTCLSNAEDGNIDIDEATTDEVAITHSTGDTTAGGDIKTTVGAPQTHPQAAPDERSLDATRRRERRTTRRTDEPGTGAHKR